MTWDGDLAVDAAVWAAELARTDNFAHDPSLSGQGENLAASTNSRPASWSAIAWYNEIEDYSFCDPVYTSNPAVGHLTQMLWTTSVKLGCAIDQGDDGYYVVCRYGPRGNINVHSEGVLEDKVRMPLPPSSS